jgi:DNA-directed RNA polymerase specialized sigma24 family protein
MLGSFSDVDDAVQEAWLRVRSDISGVENPVAWRT